MPGGGGCGIGWDSVTGEYMYRCMFTDMISFGIRHTYKPTRNQRI
jgi:hypothetical protein